MRIWHSKIFELAQLPEDAHCLDDFSESHNKKKVEDPGGARTTRRMNSKMVS
jgi:hypothetical protein